MNARRSLFFAMAAVIGAVPVAAKKIQPVRIEQTVEAQFPAALAFSTITSGEARVVINIDDEGQLADLLVTGYTDKAFADEAANLLKLWRYAPATIDGNPVGVRMELQLKFSSSGRVVSLSAMETLHALTRSVQGAVLLKRICVPDELDHPVAILKAVNPSHPGATSQSAARTGVTVVDFYVDEAGATRMPVVVETTDQTYAQAAVGALSQWRFSPPTRHGKPVAVRLQQKFIFPES